MQCLNTVGAIPGSHETVSVDINTLHCCRVYGPSLITESSHFSLDIFSSSSFSLISFRHHAYPRFHAWDLTTGSWNSTCPLSNPLHNNTVAIFSQNLFYCNIFFPQIICAHFFKSSLISWPSSICSIIFNFFPNMLSRTVFFSGP